MAAGDVTDNGWYRSIQLFADAGATTDNSAPSGSSAGVDLNDLYGHRRPDKVSVKFHATVNAAEVATADLRAWVFDADLTQWLPWGNNSATDADRGLLNDGNSVGERDTGDDALFFTQTLDIPPHYSRFYLEIESSGGAGFTAKAFLSITA